MINMRGHNKHTRSTCVRLVFLIQLSIWWSNVVSMSTELPCHFLDSINITNGIFHPNKSIIFGGNVFPEGQYAEIDYILNEGSERETVKQHLRGCLCNRKPCVRFCCSFGSLISNIDPKDCHFNESIENLRSYESDILDENNERKRVKLNQQFEIIDGSPCAELYYVMENEEYQITHVRCACEFFPTIQVVKINLFLQNGAMIFTNGGVTLTSHQYCIDFYANGQTKNYDLIMAACFDAEIKPDSHVRLIIPIGMIKNGINKDHHLI